MDKTRHEDFAKVFIRYQDQVHGYIVTMLPNWHDAEDVFQQTSLGLWQTWDRFDLTQEFLPWACGVARNMVRNFLRRRGRDRVVLSEQLMLELADLRVREQPLLEERRGPVGRVHREDALALAQPVRTVLRPRDADEDHRQATPHDAQRALSAVAADSPGTDGVHRPGHRQTGPSMSRSRVKLPPSDSELARLVELLCEGTIRPAERDRLESLLADDRDARLYCVAYLDLHARAIWHTRGRKSDRPDGERIGRCRAGR